jgi:hypothetical protein
MSIEDVVVTSDLAVLRRLAPTLVDGLAPEADHDSALDAAIRRATQMTDAGEQAEIAPFNSAT